MSELLNTRARDAKRLSDWFCCKTDRHPHGRSGYRAILPAILTTNCRDTSQDAYACSEWGWWLDTETNTGGTVAPS